MILQFLAILTWGIGDLWTTKMFLNEGGKEGNPFMAIILKKLGFKGMIVIKIIILYIIFKYYPNTVPFMILLGLWVIIWNLKRANKCKIMRNKHDTIFINKRK